MGLKKYEIITVGSDKRVRALRSWRVQDRYVNIGDVGGIVYDEKTLSQDGACWLFRGNFGFPGARIGGDSIVDVGEVGLSAIGAPNVDILGSSVVVGSKPLFESDRTAEDGVVLTAADFEQGGFNALIAGNPLTGSNSADYIRLKKPIFTGGKPLTLKCAVPGYIVTAVALDRDGLIIANAPSTPTGAGVTIIVPAGQYFSLMMTKDPADKTVPADATAAKITFTGTYETKLSIIDSRVEINPVTSTGTMVIRPGGTYTFASGAKYPEAAIRNSKVSVNIPASVYRLFRLMGQVIGSTATLDGTAGSLVMAGTYSNVNNLMVSGALNSGTNAGAYNLIQATNCDNMVVSPTIFPGLAEAQTANMPFIFQGCNVPNGIFYHHAQIANTYKNIDFAKASVDLGKTIASGEILASSEVEGMYRVYSVSGSLFGALVESHESIKSTSLSSIADSYATTIYKDAYFNGIFELKGTNVFGNSMKHEASNTQNVMAVHGMFNASTVGGVITGIVATDNRVVVAEPFRINGSLAFTVNNDTTIETQMLTVDTSGKIIYSTSWAKGTRSLSVIANTIALKVYIAFRKAGDVPITPDDVKGITVTTYNGCRIISTKATAATIVGNVRVEDNATIIDTSVTGTGYFGGNSIIQAPSALVGQLPIEGAVYMSDNAVFAPFAANATAGISLLEMRGGAMFAGAVTIAGAKHNITMADNARFLGTIGSSDGFNMHGNSFVASSGAVSSACRGLLTMKDDARIENGSLTAIGHITLCGSYSQTRNKTWRGKRVISSQGAPEYDDNVKTQYDF